MMENKEVEADDPFLPQEIIRDILTRLPVKSLIRFQCVCRHWRYLFKDPSFIADHLHRSNRQNPYILLQRGHLYDNRLDLYSLGSDLQVRRFQNPRLIEHCGEIVDSSNGLLCVQTKGLYYSPYSFLLWNPAIKEVQLVPETDFCLDSYRCGTYSAGFGFCPSLSDYKIVITYVKNRCFEMFKVYSLRSRSWKEVKYRLDACTIYYHVTVNGVMYFHGEKRIRKDHGKNFELLIFSFDLATEEWTVIPMPERHPGTVYDNFMVYEGKLAYVSCSRDFKQFVTHMWVMEEGVGASGETWNWAKKFTSKPSSSGILPKTMRGNEIVCMTYSAHTILFDPTTEKFRNVNFSNYDTEDQIFNYVESLVSVGGAKSLTTYLKRWGSFRLVASSGVCNVIEHFW